MIRRAAGLGGRFAGSGEQAIKQEDDAQMVCLWPVIQAAGGTGGTAPSRPARREISRGR